MSKYEETFQEQIVRTVAWRIFKITTTAEEIRMGGYKTKPEYYSNKKLTGDVFSFRLDIWKAYIKESLKGFGLAPYGFGKGGNF